MSVRQRESPHAVVAAIPEDLLRRHLPVLRYDSQGSFMADSPGVMTDRPGNALRRADGSTPAGAAGRPALELSFLGWPRYADGTAAARSDHLDAVGRDYVKQARDMHRDAYANRIHGRAVRGEDGGWWLQYWFFYLYNNKAFLGFGLHEGDWEMVQVRLAPDETAVAMAFAQHTHGQRAPWSRVECQGDRPIVYVARGSQASYASRGRHDAPVVPDQADGKGIEVAAATLDVIDAGAPAWVAWPGRWGSTRARSSLESDSPRGPAHQDKWHHPGTFFDECDEFRSDRSLAPPMPGPPTPEITVRREGDRAIVGYRFPQPRGRPRPTMLVVSLDDPNDGLPPATDAQPVTGSSGELEHPLALECGRFVVRVTAADEKGNVSEPAVARLD